MIPASRGPVNARVDDLARSRHEGHLAAPRVVVETDDTRHTTRREGAMFDELTDELLDLQATVQGYGAALFAVEEDACSSSCCSLCTTVVLCCHLCW
jgi:hypothetical protein